MYSENLDPDLILKERSKAVEESIRKLSHPELTALGDALFAIRASGFYRKAAWACSKNEGGLP